MNHFVLAASDNYNTDANPNNVISTINERNYVSLQSLYQENTIKNDQNALEKDLKDQCIGMNIKQKVRMKMQQISIDIFWNQTSQELTDCLFWFI